jgi:hypothetical protein
MGFEVALILSFLYGYQIKGLLKPQAYRPIPFSIELTQKKALVEEAIIWVIVNS